MFSVAARTNEVTEIIVPRSTGEILSAIFRGSDPPTDATSHHMLLSRVIHTARESHERVLPVLTWAVNIIIFDSALTSESFGLSGIEQFHRCGIVSARSLDVIEAAIR